MKLEDYMRSWTEEQWDDAERVEAELAAMLPEENVSGGYLTVLVIEERKRDPDTPVKGVADLAILLGAETMLNIRHTANQKAPALALAKQKRGKVRGV